MLLLRKILFYLFFLIYLALCPLLVFYAFGYIFNPKNLKIVQTGLVYLSTIPPQASVYIGKSRYKEKTPVVLRELLPGAYSLNVYLKGYKPWSREIDVEAGKTLVFDSLLLIPEDWNKKALSPDAFREFTAIPETHFFILAHGPHLKDYYVYNHKEETFFALMDQESALADARVIEKFTTKASSNVLFCVEWQGNRKYLWIELKEKIAKRYDLTTLFPQEPMYIEWDETDTRYIFALGKEHLNRIDAVSMAIFPKYIENVRGFGIFNKQMYFLAKSDTALLRLNYDKTNKEPPVSDIISENSFFEGKDIIRIKVFAKNILALWSKRGDFLVRMPAYTFFERNVAGVEFDKEHKKLLFWKRDKIGVLDFSEELEGSPIRPQRPKVVWLYTKGEDVLECFWVFKGSYVLLHDKSGVYLLEAPSERESALTFVTKTKRNTPVYYGEASGCLYYLDAETSRLQSLEIIPKSHLLSMPFTLEARDDSKKSEK